MDEIEIKDPKAVLDALERAKNDAKKYRDALGELETKVAELEQAKTTLEAQIEEYGSKEGQWKETAKKLTVKSMLKNGDADRIMKFMDMSTIEFDDDNNLVGFDEAFGKVKTDLPELFDVKRRVGGEVDAWAKGDTPKTMTGSEMQVANLFKNK